MNTVNSSRARLLKHIERAALLACVLLLVPISAAAQDRCVLTGPGTDYQRKGGIEMVRRDASILDLRVLDPDSSN